MSAIAIWSIHCNGRDCAADYRIPGNDAESLAVINADARLLGWLVTDRGRRHLCPDCAAPAGADGGADHA